MPRKRDARLLTIVSVDDLPDDLVEPEPYGPYQPYFWMQSWGPRPWGKWSAEAAARGR